MNSNSLILKGRATIPLLIVFLILISIVIAAPPIYAQSGSRYYAGYRLGRGYYGVSGNIYTINPAVTGWNFIAQWVCVVISYRYRYWVQVGYSKGFDTDYQLRFYVEKLDQNGYSIIWVLNPTPSAGTTYTYIIAGGIFDGRYGWDIRVRRGIQDLYRTIIYTVPYSAEDLQAFSETTTTSIRIDNTHFSGLSYYTGRSFPLWDDREARVNPPYWIWEISHYEFKAGGGG